MSKLNYIRVFSQPGPRWVWLPIVLRFLFIPFFCFCNYKPNLRSLPVFIDNDYVYCAAGILLALTSGYFSSLCMMYVPRYVSIRYFNLLHLSTTVEPEAFHRSPLRLRATACWRRASVYVGVVRFPATSWSAMQGRPACACVIEKMPLAHVLLHRSVTGYRGSEYACVHALRVARKHACVFQLPRVAEKRRNARATCGQL